MTPAGRAPGRHHSHAVPQAPAAPAKSSARPSTAHGRHAERHAERAALRTKARKLYADSVRAGRPMTGTQLGTACGMGARWGRQRIAEAKQALPDTAGTVTGPVPRPGGTPVAAAAGTASGPPTPHQSVPVH
jgi:hypothetical protein